MPRRGRGTYTDLSVRDVNRWPFSQASIWNTPIGSGATYSQFHGTIDSVGGENPLPGIRPPGILLDGSSMPLPGNGVNCSADIAYIVRPTGTDPLVTVYYQTGWGAGTRALSTTLVAQYFAGPTPWQIHWPDSVVIPDASGGQTPNAVTTVVQPDGSMFHFFGGCRLAGDNRFFGIPLWELVAINATVYAADNNISSTGMYGVHGGSALSGYGGHLTVGELTTSTAPIHHAIALDINGAEYLYYDASTKGFVWPALVNDSQAPIANYYGGYHGHYPALRMGSLLAVPPGVTEASLGLTLRPTKKLFHAMQDYGAYIVDDTGWSDVDLCIEHDAYYEFADYYGYSIAAGKPGAPWGVTQPLHDELLAIYGALQVVTNNTANNVGGGGTPRVPLAPPFAS